ASASEIGHVVTDWIVIPTIETPDLAATVAHEVIHHAQARRDFPVEGEDFLSERINMPPLLRMKTSVDRPLIQRPGILDIERLALGNHRVGCGLGLHDPIVVHLSRWIARGADKLVGTKFGN